MSYQDLYEKLDTANQHYTAAQDLFISQNQKVVDMQNKALSFEALSKSYDILIPDAQTSIESQSARLASEEGESKLFDDELLQLYSIKDLDAKEIDKLTEEISNTEKNTILILSNIYENIKDQNDKIYKKIKRINSENSLGQKKIMYLKDKTSTWDYVFGVLFYTYYLLFCYLCYLLYTGHAEMIPIWKWFISIFFALLPTVVGIYTTYPTFPFYQYVENIWLRIKPFFSKLFSKRQL